VVLGNHDGNLEPLLPSAVKLVDSTGIALFDAGFFHGNAWPAPEILQCRSLVIGHVHPTVAFRDPLGFRITAQVWVRASIDQKQLAKTFLGGMGYKLRTDEDPFKLLKRDFNTKFRASEFYIMLTSTSFLAADRLTEVAADTEKVANQLSISAQFCDLEALMLKTQNSICWTARS
jgi:metallophosphoesterase superfamily enzyme